MHFYNYSLEFFASVNNFIINYKCIYICFILIKIYKCRINLYIFFFELYMICIIVVYKLFYFFYIVNSLLKYLNYYLLSRISNYLMWVKILMLFFTLVNFFQIKYFLTMEQIFNCSILMFL